ncbi:MAG TPA: hydroxymethylbilane synthase [Vicinamibacterales bacterium]|nr:hydroxymethylbilane synthase [Vicinamibacterales bacterium]
MTIGLALRIGSRGSRLAAAQARIFQHALGDDAGRTHLVAVRTRGDVISARDGRGGFEATDGQFTAELEDALLGDAIDVAVHSYKDLPTATTGGAVVAAVLPRADARDCLVSRGGGGLDTLPNGARVGTSSVRRGLQIRLQRPDLRIEPIRGNVETRIARMDGGEYDAVILACAGLDRLGRSLPDSVRLPFDVMLPAPAQGAIAIQVRAEHSAVAARVAKLDDFATRTAVEAERSLLQAVGGGCLAPLGALGEVADGQLRLRGIYFPDPSARPARVDVVGAADRADQVVAEAAQGLVPHGRRR